jgi:Carboxypeptidase regulatory-like domain/TonB dependent receptor
MLSGAIRYTARIVRAVCVFGSLSAIVLWASVGGSISGTVKDPSGSVIAGARVTVMEVNTGLSHQTHTDSKGYYTFPVLPVGHYVLDMQASGFGEYKREGVVLDTNAALTLNASLEVGSVSQNVTVDDNTLHVETTSTQMGQVITGRQMIAVPLDGRSYTDLLSLQPGVAPATAITSSTVQDVGATILNPSGTLNPGNLSVNGQRETANYFSVNGSDVEEDVNAGTAVIPNLDAISEFRIITSNFDAEYGEYSGGQISVITKSGANAFHGNAFEFLRNTDLDARNYFSPTRGAFRQNQFGGTIGGPIRRDKLFFFLDYQGTRQTRGVDTGNIPVPSDADRTGDLLDFTTGPGGNQLSGIVGGPYFANLLTQELGYGVTAGEPYYLPGCTASSTCVFPNAVIPQKAWSVPAQRMLQYIPAPNTPLGTFATSSYNQTVRDDKAGARVDANTRWGLLSAYYFIDDFDLDDPYPVAQSGASVPGFNALTTGRAQLIALSDTKAFSATADNELHFSYMRDNTNLGQPIGGRNVSLVSQGFANPDGTPSIVALDPKGQSVENLNFNAYSTGAAANQLIQVNNTYQVADSFSKVLGNHTMKFGAEFHADQVNAAPIAQFNGNFVFSGLETGVDFADFLIGVPSQYNQSQLNPFYARNKYVGLFAQDSWHVLSNLTLNYGLRWDRIAPWSEKYNQISTFVPGAQSVVFPGAPPGILYPGDPGVPNTLAPIDKLDFSPRVGLAWSPEAEGRFLEKILGKPGTTSIRASFGNFYTAIDATSIGVLAANAPYGTTYTSPAPPLFATPFITAADGTNNGQPFPYKFAPLDSSRSNPDPNIDWSTYEPISGIPGYDIHNHTPYTEEWALSIERQAGPNTVFGASYIGSSTHRQRVLIEPNPGNPALCLSLSQPSAVVPGTLTCGAGGEDTIYYPITGGQVNGTRGPLGSNFGSNALQSNIGHANYNAFELSARHITGRLQFAAAYTYSKSMDQSSNIGEEVNPFNPALSYAISAFDVKHNFVVSYEYQLPFDQLFHPNRLTRGWSLSGITHFASGFPVTMINNGDNSLIGTNPNGVNNSSIDEPEYDGGPLHLSKNPRTNGNNYFDSTAFSMNALGTPGTAKRRFFYGPGTDNYDMAIAKNLPLAESKSLLFRVEAFNVFNHAQFNGPTAVDGDIGSSTFGNVVSAAVPRILQGALKFSF